MPTNIKVRLLRGAESALRRGLGRQGVADVCAVLPEADFVVVAVPLTAETEGLLDRRRLERLKPGAGLVNLGRARVVDYPALAALLESGHLSGAVLDVFDPEPLPAASPLWSTPRLHQEQGRTGRDSHAGA